MLKFVQLKAHIQTHLKKDFVHVLRLHVHRTSVPGYVSSADRSLEIFYLSFIWTLFIKENKHL